MDVVGAAVGGITLFRFIALADDNVGCTGKECDETPHAKSCAVDVDSFRPDRVTGGGKKNGSPADLWRSVLAFVGIVGCVIVDGVAAPPSSR